MPAIPDQAPTYDGISDRNFERLAQYIYAYSGIKMPPSKRSMLEGRLRRRIRVTGHATLDAYCQHLFEAGGDEAEAIHLIDVATTNKTDFFREPKHFEVLSNTILPDLRKQGVRRMRVWSAACSTGAEPYSLAMMLEDYSRARRDVDYRMLATDLSTEVLAKARRGVYPSAMVDPVPADLAKKYIMRAASPERPEVRIHPSLRGKIDFARLNLMDADYKVGEPMHLIFCRNVLIYFDKETQAAVLAKLCDCLANDAYLIVGHSESASGFNLPLHQVASTVYRKVPRAA